MTWYSYERASGVKYSMYSAAGPLKVPSQMYFESEVSAFCDIAR